jgi:hypothetical protein
MREAHRPEADLEYGAKGQNWIGEPGSEIDQFCGCLGAQWK